MLAAVCEKLARAVMLDLRCAVKQRHGLASVAPLHAGVMVAAQRFRSDLGLYVHLHCLVTDGVFEDLGEGMRFLPTDPPTPARMTAVLAQVHEAVLAASGASCRPSARRIGSEHVSDAS
ncbi:transposase [Nannocystis pusilla]|uniref:transposase n=1 Tax=Nannocystis pusilla TaxID=889268 RepID=UPI003DA3AB7B